MESLYLQELNEAQRQAVVCCDAPLLVIAGAGSGKTRVLTYKIAYLIEQGMMPWNILALTFTNKAAAEMRQRIEKLLGPEKSAGLWMGTFHSIFARILRVECSYLPYSQNYTIYDADDSKGLIKAIIREKGMDEKQVRPGDIAGKISDLKNKLILPAPNPAQNDVMGQIYLEYQRRLQQSDAMDFDDLLVNTYYLLQNNPEVLAKYVGKFQYILVDEYQDTNWAQDQIVWLLTRQNQHVCVVGDDAQSIYSFRGALIDNILKFQNRYDGGRLFKLEQNYRSTQTIVNAANSLINCNSRQIQKQVYSERAEGEPIQVLESYTDKEEAKQLVRRIQVLRREGNYSLNDFAMLYRTNNQSRTLEEELLQSRIPYHIYGGISFYQRKVVKDALAYLRLAANPHDEESLRRVINYPARGIGKTTLDKVYACALDNQTSIWEVVCDPAAYSVDVNAGTRAKLMSFADIIRQLSELAVETPVHELAMKTIELSGMRADVAMGKEQEDEDRRQNLQELLDAISAFQLERFDDGESATLTDYLQMVSLISDLDSQDKDDTPKVTLMTIHAAKGLEFPVVLVSGMEEDLFPSQQAIESHNVEEERRLCYVAMTRAMDRLVLSWSHTRVRFGHFENCEKSRFLREIDRRYLSSSRKQGSLMDGQWRSTQAPSRPATRSAEQPSRPAFHHPVTSAPSPASTAPASRPAVHPASEHRPGALRSIRSVTSSYTSSAKLPDNQALKQGDRIEHSRFGKGVVLKIEGTGLDTKATVEFEACGTKQLLLRFAKFTLL